VPELPEVEITKRGIEPHIVGKRIQGLLVRDRRLRWPVEKGLERKLKASKILSVARRAKYILVNCDPGCLIIHLGMSGSLRILSEAQKPGKHDHFDLTFEDGSILRYRDPRRFGALLWTEDNPNLHPRIKNLGPEPLESKFDWRALRDRISGSESPIKLQIMKNEVVVGVGNIYANESLFRAGIHPHTIAKKVGAIRSKRLVAAIKETLASAIEAGGSSLRDFYQTDGTKGYFQQNYFVYGQGGKSCRVCGHTIRSTTTGQRSTFFCPYCQRR